MRIKLAVAVAVLLALGLPYMTGTTLHAQLPMPASTQFDMTGFLQEATLDTPGDSHSGGTLKVNGISVIVPRETIVQFPANPLTWQELFAQAPAPWGIPGNPGVSAFNNGVSAPTSGMAAADCAVAASPCTAPPLTTYEVHLTGNRVGDRYIAGLIEVSQQGLNSGAGFVNFIDYSVGELRVGGTLGTATGVRVRLNDPSGRYGRPMSPDIRFTVDPDNPTISAGTGYPMCIPRNAPSGVIGDPQHLDDQLCPEGNRPVGTWAFMMNAPGTGFPDPTIQAPFEVGDYISFAGTLIGDNAAGPTVGPNPGADHVYVSAHTIESNVSITTQPGVNPAYIRTDVMLIGTGGLTVLGAGEAVIRTRFEGMSTDPSRLVHLYGIDIDPLTGKTTDRDWGTIGVDPGAPNGAVLGRWRFRPPCLAFGTVPTKPDKQCVMNAIGTFLPPTREMRSVIEGQQTQVAALNAGDLTKTAANGIYYGQYHAPIFEYIFPENVPGSPIVENNYNTIDFLSKGGYTSSAGTQVGQLSPWPSNIVPTAACVTPVASAGGPYTVASGGSVTVTGSSSGTQPVTFLWTATAGTFLDATSASTTYTAPATGPQTVTLTATNSCGTNSAASSVVVNPPQAPTVTQVAPISVFSAKSASFVVSGTDPNVPAKLPLTFSVTQAPAIAGGPVLGSLTVRQGVPNSSSATVSFVAPTLPAGQVTSSVVNLSITATNSAGVVSAVSSTSVTVQPVADQITITIAQYRTSKQRLDLTVSDTTVSPNIVLTLQPYITTGGVLFNPSSLGNTLTNGGAGLYTLTLVGAPPPACGNPTGAYATPCPTLVLTVKSNIGGSSPATALTNIRQ
jgi:hypothetical protein